MHVAVSGADGFIGRHVITQLAQYPVKVTAVVRKETDVASLEARGVRVIKLDLNAAPPTIYHLLERPDVLIHLAWGGLPNYGSLHHFECELPIQYKFLSELVRDGLPALTVAGTCFEYGMQCGELNEDLDAQPTNPYGFAKDSLRRQLEYLGKIHPFSLVWARLFYLYGPGQAPTSLLQQLNSAVARGDSVFNMSGGEQLRDYLPVSDVAASLVKLALRREDFGIVNICSGRPTSVRKIVEDHLLINNFNIKINLGHFPYPSHEPFAFWGSRKKLDRLMNSVAAEI